jgi:hypothetical protein
VIWYSWPYSASINGSGKRFTPLSYRLSVSGGMVRLKYSKLYCCKGVLLWLKHNRKNNRKSSGKGI